MIKQLASQYRGVFNIFSRYWASYGGTRAVLLSPYLHASIVISLLLRNLWIASAWSDMALSILPNLLGFTLGGFAIWISFGDDRFRDLVSRKDGDRDSAYIAVNSSFTHFVVVQIVALISALIGKSMAMSGPLSNIDISALFVFGRFIGFSLFIYALMTALAASMGILRAAHWFDAHKRNQNSTD